MQAFRIYGKIMSKQLLGTLIMYICIFLAVAILQIKLSAPPELEAFEASKISVAVINYDNSELSENLEEFINSNTKAVDIGTTAEEIKDAIFHGCASYAIVIPDGFAERFAADDPLSLETYVYPNSTGGTYIEMMTNSYLSYAKMYLDGTGSIDFEKLGSTMQTKAEVEIIGEVQTDSSYSPVHFFNYLAYPLMALMLIAVPTSFIVFNKTDIKRRNLCSPINPNLFSLQLVLGAFIITVAVFIIFIIAAVCLDKDLVLSKTGALLVLNAFIFTVVCMAIGFFVSSLVRSRQAITAVSNVVSLGVAFTGGIFVPLAFMQEGVKKIAVINPGFWFVRANEKIAAVTSLSLSGLKPAFGYMLIQLAFAAAFISLALVASKLKRQSDN